MNFYPYFAHFFNDSGDVHPGTPPHETARKSHFLTTYIVEARHAVAQLVETLRNKSEGREFGSRWCQWNISLTYSFRPHYGPGIDSASNRNEYQKYFLGVKAA